jgi:tetratricopeptide (TPR) repeat protein
MTGCLAWAWPTAAQSVTVVVPQTGPAHEAWQALEEGRYRDAVPLFERALQRTPPDPVLLLGSGIVARRLGQTDVAQASFTQALQINPALTPASLLLGMILRERGDLDGGIRVYEAALVRAPNNAQLQAHLDRWRREAELHSGFRQAGAGHFTVLFEGAAEEAIAKTAVEILEGAYVRIGDALLVYPSEPMTVILYTRDQFRDITRSPAWAGGLFDGRIRIPVQGGLRDRREFERVLVHEYVHAVVHSVAPSGLPMWLSEGTAVALERQVPAEALRSADRSAADVTPDELRGSFATLPAERVVSAYNASGSLVRAIIDRVGLLGLVALMTDLSAGENFDEAFAARVQVPFSAFVDEWRSAGRAGLMR